MSINTEIADHFLSKLVTSDKFFSANPVKDYGLLFPAFWAKLQKSVLEFNKKYPAIEVILVETYRSNSLQLQHYNNGASGIKKDGMHHFGIAADLAFKINGKFSYNGDYKHLRACHTAAGLYLIAKNDAGHVQFIPVSKEAQGALRLTVNNTVKAFQKKYGLKVDAIPGKNTIAKAKEVFK